MRQWRILHTESSLGWGGQEVRVFAELEWMRAHGHWVALAAHPDSAIAKRAREAGIPFYPLRTHKALLPFEVVRLAAWLIAQPRRRRQHAQLQRRLAGRARRAAGRAADPDPLAPHRGRLPEPLLERRSPFARCRTMSSPPASGSPTGWSSELGVPRDARDLHRHRRRSRAVSIPAIEGTLRAGTRPRAGCRAGRHDLRAAQLERPRDVSRGGRATARRSQAARSISSSPGTARARGTDRTKSRRRRGRTTSRCSAIAPMCRTCSPRSTCSCCPPTRTRAFRRSSCRRRRWRGRWWRRRIGGIPEVVEDGVTGLLVRAARCRGAGGENRRAAR